MPWLSRNNFTPTDKLHADDLNNLANDQRTWGGNVNGGGHILSNVTLVGVQTQAAVGAVFSVFGRSADVVAMAGDYTVAQVTGAVPNTRQVIAGPGLAGGGPLSADVTLSAQVVTVFGRTGAVTLTPADITAASGVLQSRNIITGTGLAGGGNLSFDRSLSVVPDSTNQQVQVLLGGSSIGTRHAINFLNGANVTVAVADNQGANRIDITVSSTGGTGGMGDPTTTLGDLIVRGPVAPTRLAAGSNGQVLTADNTQPLGLRWATGAGGGAVNSVFGRVGTVVAMSGDYAAAQIANAVDVTQSYANPGWIASLAWSKITSAPAFLADPTAVKGDLIARGATTSRLAVGADNLVLTADSSQALGVRWASIPVALQSPWTMDIDGSNHILRNVKSIGSGNIAPGANNPLAVLVTSSDVGAAVSSVLFRDAVSQLQFGCSTTYTPTALPNTGSPWIQAYLATGDPCPIILQPAGPAGTVEPAGVGVGQKSPKFALDVLGDINLTGIYRVGGVPISATPGLQSPWVGDIDAANHVLNNVNGIGIGAPAGGPILRVQTVNPNILMQSPANTDTASIQMWAGSFHWELGVGLPSAGVFYIRDSGGTGAVRLQINAAGQIGLGHPASYLLDVAGDINCSGVFRINGIPAGNVSSVFGRTGVVIAASGDYNASQVANAVDQTQSYANPNWLTALAWSKITGAPATGVSTVFGRSGAIVAATGDYTVAQVTGAVASTRLITAGTGLTGGGNLSADRTFAVVPDSTNQQVQVLSGGAAVGTRRTINFISGANVSLSITDSVTSNRVDVTVSSTGGSGGMVDPTTNIGDIIVRGNTAVSRLAVGTNGQVLTADSAQLLGVKWAAAAGGSGSQSPWTSNIDAANFALDHVSGIGVNAAANLTAARVYAATGGLEDGFATVSSGALNYASMSVLNDIGDSLRVRSYGSSYPTDPGMASLEASGALKISANGAEIVRLISGRALIGTTTDDTVNRLQVNGKIKSLTGGFVFPDGTTQTTAVTAASAPVSSVFGRVGAVVAQNGDYTAAQVSNAVATTSSYADPVWITSLAWSKITGAPASATDPLTTKGDLIVRGASATVRIGVGADGQVLTADSTQALGVKWATATGGSQTPWSQDIDGGGHSLTNVVGVTCTNLLVNSTLQVNAATDLRGTVIINPQTDTAAYLGFYRAGVARWLIGKTGGETGSGNTGSDFYLFRYGDDGSNIGFGWAMTRANGNVAFQGDINITKPVTGMASYSLATFEGVSAYFGALSNLAFVGTFSNHPFWIYSNGSPAIQVGTNGSVGIGSAPSPGYLFDVFGTSRVQRMIVEKTVTAELTLLADGVSTTLASKGDAGFGYVGTFSAHPFNIYVNAATVLQLSPAGNAGVGVFPAFKLDVAGDVNITGNYLVNGTPIVTGGGGGGAVSSVFTRTGAVIAQTGDYTAAQISNAVSTIGSYADPAWITSLAWSKISGAPVLFADPTTTKGDLIARGSGPPAARLGVGTNNWVLTADSSQALGMKWAAVPVASVFSRTGAVVATAGDYTAAMITNAVDTTQSYSNPAWITALAWAKVTGAPAFLTDPTTAKGDIIARGSASPATRLGIGLDGQVLMADASQALGVKWATPTTSGGASNATAVAVVSGGTAISNSATQASLFAGVTTTGSLTIPAAAVIVGGVIDIGIVGTMAMPASTPPTITVTFLCGGVSIGTLAFTVTAALTSKSGKFTIQAWILRNAATTSVLGGVIRLGQDDANASTVQGKLTAGTAFNLTNSCTLDVQAKFGTAVAGSSIANDLTQITVRNPGTVSGGGFLGDVTTTKGDLLVRSATAVTRLGLSATDGWVLTADSTQTLGVKWAAAAAGGAAQTPWTSNIDGGAFALSNVSSITATGYIYGAGGVYGASLKVGLEGVAGVGVSSNAVTFMVTGGVGRWNIINYGTETGANSGSDLYIQRINDAGNLLGNPITISRATGIVDFTANPTVNNVPLVNFMQSPWVMDIDAATHVLYNANAIIAHNSVQAGDQTAGGKALILLPTAFEYTVNGLARWYSQIGNPETGGDSGSDFQLFRYSDTGGYKDFSLIINRNTGDWLLNGNVTFQNKNLSSINCIGIGTAAQTPNFPIYIHAPSTAGISIPVYIASHGINNYGLVHSEDSPTGFGGFSCQNDSGHFGSMLIFGSNHPTVSVRNCLQFNSNSDTIFATSYAERMRIVASGNIGIGTANPQDMLHVASSGYAVIRIDSPSVPYINFTRGANPWWLGPGMFSTDTFALWNVTANTAFWAVTAAGQMGIGITTNTTYQLQLGLDTAAKSATSTWTVPSDSRLKRNIKDLVGGLDIIKLLRPIEAEYNGLGGTQEGQRVLSFLAEEIREVLPETVRSARAKLHKDDERETDILDFNLHEVLIHLVLAVKQLAAKIEPSHT